MYIKGIGNVKKEEVASILTRDGKDAIESGEMTWEEAGEMYKLEQVRKYSEVGAYGDTFAKNFARIPDGVYDKLSPEECAELVDAFYTCYGDGKNAKEK